MDKTYAPKEQIDLYLQNLLKLQYQASKEISHRLTKGELRENFIKRLVHDEFPNLTIANGILLDGNWQSSQADFLILNEKARMGSFKCYDLCDCKLFMEIKSNLQKKELQDLNNIANTIKSMCKDGHKIIVGMFCYSSSMKDRTLIKNFGYSYDEELEAYDTYKKEIDLFKDIDFVFSLNIVEDEETSPYFIARDNDKKPTLFLENPVIKYLFNYFR